VQPAQTALLAQLALLDPKVPPARRVQPAQTASLVSLVLKVQLERTVLPAPPDRPGPEVPPDPTASLAPRVLRDRPAPRERPAPKDLLELQVRTG